MYNEWLSHMSKAIQKDISFFYQNSNGADKNEFIFQFIYLFTASFVCKNTHATYLHKHQKIKINNILTSGSLNTMSFSTICIFREYVTWKIVC